MILVYLILILLAGALLSLIVGKWSALGSRIISAAILAIDLVLTLSVFFIPKIPGQQWLINLKVDWIPELGIGFHFALDGISLLLLLLTFFIGFISIIFSWKEINQKVGFFNFNFLLTLAGIVGVFLSLDLFLFYFFWELMLIPMFLLIGIWGNENRTAASYKFFLFTQIGGLLMLISILTIYFIHGHSTGTYTFDYEQLIGTKMSATTSYLIMLGFLAAFFVKLPVIPLHNWLPDTYTAAPTSVTLLLAALLSKTAAYGLIRFIYPLFPDAAASFAPVGMILGIVGILYGAKLAYAQTDLKRLIAYTSISHMGFIILGVFAFNQLAFQGVVMQMLAHGISIGALFIIAGILIERLHTRELDMMGGLWSKVPALGAMGIVFSMASLGLPGFGNFIAEFLILLGTFKANIVMASVASVGLLASAIYTLRMIQRIFFGKIKVELKITDINLREKLIFGSLIVIIVWLGLFPKQVLKMANPAVLKTLTYHNVQLSEKTVESKNQTAVSNLFLFKH